MSPVRQVLLCVIALAFSALFVRLGIWQLDRHGERVASAETRSARAAQPSLTWAAPADVPGDTTGLLGRRARLTGRWDREHEVILRSRTLEGRAGAEVLTPLRIGGEAGATVMVLRGWLPAADGLRADLEAAWSGRGTGAETVEGIFISSRDGRGGQPLWVDAGAGRHLALAGIDLAQAREQLSIDLSPHVLRASDPEPGGSVLGPAREIETGGGPHLSYTVQWFSFALITLLGTAILIRKERRRGPQKVL